MLFRSNSMTLGVVETLSSVVPTSSVMLFIGVNGVGKTTSIGKVARLLMLGTEGRDRRPSGSGSSLLHRELETSLGYVKPHLKKLKINK